KPSAPEPISDLFPPKSAKYITPDSEQEGRALLEKLNRKHLEQWQGDTRLDALVASYELAAKMQLSAPEVLDITGESEATRKCYGLEDKSTQDSGRSCLIERRMSERGVRFVQVWSGMGGATGNWDNHANIQKERPPMAAATDKPAAALVKDLNARGLFDDTL